MVTEKTEAKTVGGIENRRGRLLLGMLSTERKLRILQLLATGINFNVKTIACITDLMPTTASIILSGLTEAGVIGRKKVGREVYYYLTEPKIIEVLKVLKLA